MQRASESTFLHPIVRYYAHGTVVKEHQVIEDWAAVWSEPEHVLPLQAFISGVLVDQRTPELALRERLPDREPLLFHNERGPFGEADDLSR